MAKIKIKENRRAKEARKKQEARVDFNQAGQIQNKIDVIADFLGLRNEKEEER